MSNSVESLGYIKPWIRVDWHDSAGLSFFESPGLISSKNEISKQLADLFNLSFMTGVFPSVLKAAKVVPVFKKDSKFMEDTCLNQGGWRILV